MGLRRPGSVKWPEALIVLGLIVWALCVAGRGSAPAGDWQFTRVIGPETTIPGRSEPFLALGMPSLDLEGNLVFCGFGASGGYGLYLLESAGGALRVVADRDTPIPGQETTFAHGFRSYGASIDGGVVAFYAFTQSTELGGGVYIFKDGTVHLVADGNTSVPGGVATFNAIEDPLGFGPFSHPAIHAGSVAFRAAADSPRQRGVYTWIDGTLDVVANLSTPVPGWYGDFTFLSAEISMESGKVVFRGEGQDLQRGIYTNLAGPLAKVADKTEPIPGGTGTFTSVEFPWLDGGRIFFAGRGAEGQQGIYRSMAGSLSVVVDTRTSIPGGSGTFADFDFSRSQPSSSGGNVLFRALGSDGRQGIYLDVGGLRAKVVDTSDTLDGRSPTALFVGTGSLSGSTVAFLASFDDQSSAIYLATPIFLRGDPNADGSTDLSDAISILLFLFLSEYQDAPCPKSFDADDDGTIDISDAVSLLHYIFLNGPRPGQPFPCCGGDATPDVLPCQPAGPCA